MHVHRSRYLIIVTFALVATLVIPPNYAQTENPESLLVNVTAKTWKNTTVLKIENSQDNIYDIKLVWLTLENGEIKSFKSVEGWSGEIGSNPNTIQFRTDTNTIAPGESATFGIKSDQSQPVFTWIIVDEDGDELGSGVLDVAKAEELTVKEEELRKKEQELEKKEQELTKLIQILTAGKSITTENSDGRLDGSTANNKPSSAIPPAIQIRPQVIEPGSLVKILGEGFTPNSRVTVLFDGNILARLDVGSDGTVKERILMPGEVVKGTHQISVSDREGRAANITITVEIELRIIPLTADVEKQTYRQGELVKITGTGKPGSAVHLTVENPTGLYILSIAVPVDKEGNYAAFIPLSEDASPGNYRVIAKQEGKTFETSYTVQTISGREITVVTDKFEYKVGENVRVFGIAFPNRDVNVVIFSPDGSEVLNTIVKADESGSYEVSTPIPSTSALGKYSAVVRVDDEEISITFTVISGSISLTVQAEKENYRAGELVRISGKGKPNDKVSIIIETPKEEQIKMSAVTEDDGSYTALWLVSSMAKGGKYKIMAQQGDEIAETAFVVSS